MHSQQSQLGNEQSPCLFILNTCVSVVTDCRHSVKTDMFVSLRVKCPLFSQILTKMWIRREILITIPDVNFYGSPSGGSWAFSIRILPGLSVALRNCLPERLMPCTLCDLTHSLEIIQKWFSFCRPVTWELRNSAAACLSVVTICCIVAGHINLPSKHCCVTHKGNAVPLQVCSGPEGSRKLRFSDFMTAAQHDGKNVSLTHRPPLPPGYTPGTHFCWMMSRPQGHSATGRIMSLKNSSNTIGNRNRDLPVCSIMP
jgi:hypothetical protein